MKLFTHHLKKLVMNSKKLIAGLIIGVAAGTFIALFLQSDKGKELMEDVKDTASDVEDSLRAKLKSFDNEVSDLMKKGKEFVSDLEDKAKRATKSAKNATS